MLNPAVFFSRRWRWPTVVVILGMIFLARLGTWQLDRLEWRRALNEAKAAELAQPPLSLNDDLGGLDLTGLANRPATAVGAFDFPNQFLIEAQIFNGRQGRYLVTPLRLRGRNEAVLINRGWIPDSETEIGRYNSPAGEIELAGFLQTGETLSGGRRTEISNDRRLFRIDVAAMAATLPYEMLPVYLVPPPADPPDPSPPYRIETDLSLDEGNHLSYAIQWFSFAVLLGIIYFYYVSRQENRGRLPKAVQE